MKHRKQHRREQVVLENFSKHFDTFCVADDENVGADSAQKREEHVYNLWMTCPPLAKYIKKKNRRLAFLAFAAGKTVLAKLIDPMLNGHEVALIEAWDACTQKESGSTRQK